MSRTYSVDPFDLKEHEKASELIPEMSEEVWVSFFDNVKEFGIRQPLDINQNNEVLDGRHRLRAAKELKIEKIEVRQHELTEDEQLEFVRDTAIEVKELTPAEKHKIFTNAESLIKDIYEKGEKIKKDNAKDSVLKREGRFGSDEPKRKLHNTSEEVGKAIGVSSTTVIRLNRVKRENPDLYEKVVEGKKTANGAYYELPTVKQPTDNKTRGKTKKEDVEPTKTPKPRQFNQQPPKLSNEEISKQMFEANIETFFRHLKELEGFIGRTENFKDVVQESIKRDSASMVDYAKALEKTINLIKTEAI